MFFVVKIIMFKIYEIYFIYIKILEGGEVD